MIARTDVRVRSFLNCSKIGMPISSLAKTGETPGPGELFQEENFNRSAFSEIYQKYQDEILGIKIRLTPNICPKNPLILLEKAIDVAEEFKIKVTVHSNHALGVSTEDILCRLRKGDIFTHTFHEGNTGIFDEKGILKSCVQEARKRGVIFDTGHGVNSLSFKVLSQAAKIGFYPDTISTDLHNLNIKGPVYDMPTTISKFLCVGMTLSEALKCCISNPVKLLGLKDKITVIQEGSRADFVVIRVMKGDFCYQDAMKNYLHGKYRLRANITVTGNKIYYHV